MSDLRFAEYFRKRRIELGRSQLEISMDLGVHPFTISRWERHVSSPPIDYAMEIVEQLGGKVQIIDESEGEYPLGRNDWQE